MSSSSAAPGPVLVTGAAGFVGRALVEHLGESALPFAHGALNICDPAAIDAALAAAVQRHHAWAVINAAALADVDRCEQRPEDAWRVNAVGPGLLAAACARRGLRFVHISTDYVFGGDPQRAFSPDDPTGPVNHYGATKLEGEKRVLEACPEAIIGRIAWVYGHHGRGFGSTVAIRLARGEGLEAISDRFGHPTYVRDAARRLLELAVIGRRGIYHVVNQGLTSWYGFAVRLVERLALPGSRVRPISRLELPPAPAPRPVRVALEDPGLAAIALPPLRHWQEAQDAFLRELVAAGGDGPGRAGG